jgi:hypothetical protein
MIRVDEQGRPELLARATRSSRCWASWSTNRQTQLASDEIPRLRRIVAHMIQEYARHNGHVDLLRESVDGRTGE